MVEEARRVEMGEKKKGEGEGQEGDRREIK